MSNLFATRTLSLLLVGSVLVGCLSPIATGMLVCMGDGTAPNCCRNSSVAQRSVPEEQQHLARVGCECCIRVNALGPEAGVSFEKKLLDVTAVTVESRNAAWPSYPRVLRATVDYGRDSRLSSLRSVILLI